MTRDALTAVLNPSDLAALRSLRLLDTPAEPALDRLARLASKILHTPVAVVWLVDADRQFLGACVGLPEPWASRRETPLSHSFCQHVVAGGEPSIIPNAGEHLLLRDNPAVHDLGLASYLGIPLVTSDGHAIGSFCVMDFTPREWTDDEVEILKDLTASVMSEIQLRGTLTDRERAVEALRELEQRVLEHTAQLQAANELKEALLVREQAARAGAEAAERDYRGLFENAHDAILIFTPVDEVVLDVNHRACQIYGFTRSEFVGMSLEEISQNVSRGKQQIKKTLEEGVYHNFETVQRRKDGTEMSLEINAAAVDYGGQRAILSINRDTTERKRAEEEIKRRNRELAALNAITSAVSSSLNLSEVLATFKRLVAKGLGVPGGAIFFRHEVKNQFYLQDGWGLPPAMLAELKILPVTGYHSKQVIPGKRPVLTPDFRQIALFGALGLDVARPQWQSYLCVPLVAEGGIQGVMGLFSQAPTVFSEHQIVFFSAVGQQVGVAIQHARLFERVRAGHERLQALSQRLVELQETERQHLARELHDEVGQVLTGLKLSLEMSARLPADRVTESLAKALVLANELIARVRNLSLDLRPTMLDDLGLLPTLLWHFDRYTTLTQVRVLLEHSGLDRRFPPAVETAAYRIVQEALTNVARHAGETEVRVRLWTTQRILGVEIADRGIGFDPEATLARNGSSGLIGMRERARLLGGELRVKSAPGSGACLTAELPLGEPSDASGDGTDDHRHAGGITPCEGV